MGPASGNKDSPNNNQAMMEEAQKSGSFKNPWTTISRPMNQFMDVNPIEYERHEKEKLELAKVLQEQIEEKKQRQKEEREKRLREEKYFEDKLAKDRMEMAMKEKMERDMA